MHVPPYLLKIQGWVLDIPKTKSGGNELWSTWANYVSDKIYLDFSRFARRSYYSIY